MATVDGVKVCTRFVEGRYVPTYWLALRLFLRYLKNREEVDAALRRLPDLWRALGELERTEPALYAEIRRLALVDAVRSMPAQLDDEQLAFLSGRVVRVLATMEPGETPARLSARMGATLLAVFATDAPALWVRGLVDAAQRKLDGDTYRLSLPARKFLDDITRSGKAVVPTLVALSKGPL